ncbi:MAG: hypothetical protein KGL74_07530 [Elusimicrobia bacterium]|nr:hypothetical protein [Elusimicrobiota bacterium]MDE2510957.1 hypothetical protein [Elusimicrobiota bacterium]
MAEQKQAAVAAGRLITSYAFKYAGTFYDFADEKFPELKRYASGVGRGVMLEAAITVAVLLLLERRHDGPRPEDLREGVRRSYAPSVQHRNIAAVQDLACVLLQSNRDALKAAEIPSFEPLVGAPDAKLMETTGLWLMRAISKKRELDPGELAAAAAVGRSAFTSAKMIVRMIQSKNKTGR